MNILEWNPSYEMKEIRFFYLQDLRYINYISQSYQAHLHLNLFTCYGKHGNHAS